MTRVTLFLLLVAVIYQVTAAPYYAVEIPAVGRVTVDLVLVAVAALAVRGRSRRGIIVPALLAGLVIDALSVDPFFTHVTSHGVTAWVGTGCGRRGLAESPLARSLFLALATGLGTLAGLGWFHLTAYPHLAPSWQCWGLEWAYHSGLGVVVLGLLEPFATRRGQQEKAWYANG